MDNEFVVDLESLENYARENFIPVVPTETAHFLGNLIKEYQPKNILEIGTAIGYSGTLMLKNSSDATLTTLDIDHERLELAKKTFSKFNLSKRVNVLEIDAMDFLKNCKSKFDFIFLDGPKGQYIKYLPLLKNTLCKNGLLVADDVNFMGKVLSDEYPVHKHRTFIVNLRKFLQEIQNDVDFESTMYHIGECVLVAKKIK